jgi:acyl-CoA reductase-like NAD-dependent aldehyde dehydrogenase
MFGIFDNGDKINDAKIFMGSSEESREKMGERKSPYSGEVVSRFPICSKADAKRALEIAQKASKVTAKSPLHRRVAWLEDVAEGLKRYREDIALTIVDEVAKPLAFARVEVDRCIETIELTAKELVALHGETIPTDITPSGKQTLAYFKRVPVGVVACITPFNFPLNLVAHKIAPALGAGNAVVLKPTPEAPLTAYKLAKLFVSSEYAIENALSLVWRCGGWKHLS